MVALVATMLAVSLALVAPSYAASSPSPSPSPSGDEAGATSFCAEGVGVSVIVDATAAGGDVTEACVATDGQEEATDVLEQAGVELTSVANQPGFVCQVDGLPSGQDCSTTPAGDAYWGLFIAGSGTGTGDGSGDSAWDYAPVGVDELRLSPDSFVGFAYQTSSEPAPPAAPAVAGTQTGTTTGPSGDETVLPNDGASIPSTPGTDASEAADEGVEDGTPVWIFYVVVVVVAVGGLVFATLRNRAKKRRH